MLRRVVTFFLINTYCSLGHPLSKTEVTGYLGKDLQLLAFNCSNKFLSIQIRNSLEVCNITLSNEREVKETELECLIFYDISSQLCTTLKDSALDLIESYNAEVNQSQQVQFTCTEASKNWKFTNLTGYPKYYNTSQTVLKNTVKCVKACGVKDIYSEDTNFFCKYYQWGSKLLQLHPLGTSLAADMINGDISAKPVLENIAPRQTNLPITQNSAKVQSGNEHLHSDNTQEQTQVQLAPPNLKPKKDIPVANVPVVNISAVNIPAVNIPASNDSQLAIDNLNVKSSLNKEIQPSALAPHTSSSVRNDIEQLQQPSIDLPIINNAGKNPPPSKEHQSAEPDDDLGNYDGEESDPAENILPHEELSIDGNDPSLPVEPKPKEDKQIQHKNPESSLNIPDTRSDIYTNTMPDQFNEVDDHFFSFFLTATILVIFFYVLYHNKGKFRKVFLGLLVEGRQPGRRRNSRGHEYRRLDTLEQAMSTNSTAPPSKIIY